MIGYGAYKALHSTVVRPDTLVCISGAAMHFINGSEELAEYVSQFPSSTGCSVLEMKNASIPLGACMCETSLQAQLLALSLNGNVLSKEFVEKNRDRAPLYVMNITEDNASFDAWVAGVELNKAEDNIEGGIGDGIEDNTEDHSKDKDNTGDDPKHNHSDKREDNCEDTRESNAEDNPKHNSDDHSEDKDDTEANNEDDSEGEDSSENTRLID